MHTPSYFKVSDPDTIDAFIRANSFATLISTGDIYPLATHIPLELEINSKGQQVLWGHISKGNPQWQVFEKAPKVLATFLSPIHHYISSSWYGQANVPTWNYLSAQVSGHIRIIQGEDLIESLRRIVDKYERDSVHPVSFDTMPEQVQQQMLGIVAFEIQIERKEASFKLSQNRNDVDFENVIRELRLSKDPLANALALEMVKYRNG